MSFLILAIALLLGGWLAFSKRLNRSESWKATLTPLASIMGSGFLISAPLLGGLVGKWALFAMFLLLIVAYCVGGAIRYNIRHFEPIENEKGDVQKIALISRFVLAGAYFISVVYYLELLAAFALHIFGLENRVEANLITSGLLVLIALIGWTSGLNSLEKVERYAVALNLGMVGSLLIGLFWFNLQSLLGGEWALPSIDSSITGNDLRVLLGLLIVVQGFETSRYLGSSHSPQQRIETMRRAQWISGAIYLVFVGLATVLFSSDMGGDVTAILVLTKQVAIVLPALLTVAALGSQFSAGVADTAGAGGLLNDLTRGKLSGRSSYLLILVVTLTLTWVVDVNEVIAMASRAFALFYALQCLVACVLAIRESSVGKGIAFGGLSILCLLVVIFGIPAEG